MQCKDGTNDCRSVEVKLPKKSCFHIHCGSSGTNCQGFKVLPRVVGETDFTCHCTGTNCGWTSQYSYCENTTDSDPCGAGICPATLPVCMRDTTTVDCGRLATTTTTTLARSVAADAGGEVQGDPHLRALDGKHYTLLKQGKFLLWGFQVRLIWPHLARKCRLSVGPQTSKSWHTTLVMHPLRKACCSLTSPQCGTKHWK